MLTAVMLSWKRPRNAHAVMNRLRTDPAVARVLVWNNNRDVTLPSSPQVRVVQSSENFGVHARFALGLLAETEPVLVVDDDLLPGPGVVEKLYAEWKKETDVVHGLLGRAPNVRGDYEAVDCWGRVPIVLGRTFIVRRSCFADVFSVLDRFSDLPRTIPGNGDDILLSCVSNARSGRWNLAHRLPFQELPAPHALSAQPTHLAERNAIVRRCVEVFGPGVWLDEPPFVVPPAAAETGAAADLLRTRIHPKDRDAQAAVDLLAEKSAPRLPCPVQFDPAPPPTSLARGEEHVADELLRATNLVTGARPLVVHCPGVPKLCYSEPQWRRVLDGVDRASPRRLRPETRLTILTWNSRDEASTLERQFRDCGIPLLVLGKGFDSWRNICKIPLTREACERIETEFVAGLDAFDVCLLGSPALLLRRYMERFEAPLVYSADENFVPHQFDRRAAESRLPGAASRWRFLNSGAWIGRTEFVRGFYTRAAAELAADPSSPFDQFVLHKRFLAEHPQVQLDYRCELFQNINVSDSCMSLMAEAP